MPYCAAATLLNCGFWMSKKQFRTNLTPATMDQTVTELVFISQIKYLHVFMPEKCGCEKVFACDGDILSLKQWNERAKKQHNNKNKFLMVTDKNKINSDRNGNRNGKGIHIFVGQNEKRFRYKFSIQFCMAFYRMDIVKSQL